MCNVDPATGRLSISAVDFELPGRIPFILDRHYRSTNLWLGDLGYGWSHPYGVHLWRDQETLWFRGADGRRIPFEIPTLEQPSLQPSERAVMQWLPPAMIPWPSLQEQLDRGVLVITVGDQFTLLFDGRPSSRFYPLRGIADANENLIQVWPGAAGMPAKMEDPHGRVLEFHRGGSGTLREITLSQNGTDLSLVSYDYDVQQNLIAAHCAAGSTVYEYLDHRVVKYYDRCGGPCSAEYDRQGRCFRTSGPNKVLERTFDFDPDGRKTTVKDSLGHFTVLLYDENQKIIQTIDKEGGVSSFDHDDKSRMVRAIDQMGFETTICFDDRGAQVGKVRPDGSAEGLESDDRGRIVKMITAAGAVTEVDRDDFGRITRWKLPGRGEHKFAYAEDGSILSMELPAGKKVFFQWSPDRRGVTEADAVGTLGEYRFDLSGRMVSQKDPMGFDTHYSYDKYGYRKRAVYSDGSALQVSFDAGGHLTELRDEEGSVTNWKYDEAGRRVEASLPSGETILCSFDTENRVTGIRGPEGLWHRYDYTPRGLVSRQEFSDGRVESYRYDPRGLMSQMIDSSGGTIDVTRDDIGRATRILYPDRTEKLIQYDEDDRWTRAVWDGHYRERELTPEGQAVQERQDDYYLNREFGEDGSLLSITDSFGRRATYSRDDDGRVTQVEIFAGRWEKDSWLPSSPPRLHEFEYDRSGNLIEWRMPSGKVEKRKYDSRHRMIEQAIRINDMPVLVRKYRYDRRGRLIDLADSRRGGAQFAYDDAHRIKSVGHDGQAPRQYQYNDAGDLVSEGFRYARGHRVIETRDLRLEYDQRGFLARRHSRNGMDEFTHTAYGLLRDAKLSDGRHIHYEYDPHSRLVKKSSEQSEHHYFWEGDRLWAMENTGGPLVEFSYLPEEWAPFEQFQGGAAYSVHTDHVGRVLELIDDDGNIVWSNDAGVWGEGWGRPDHSVVCPFGMPGQIWDEFTGFFYNRFRYYYPEIAHYTAPDPIGIWGGLDCYRYVPDPINHMDPLGTECRNKTDDPALYRGDRRPPETICGEGFRQWNPGGDMSLAEHVNGSNSTSQWVSTTYNREMAHEASSFGTSHDPDIGPRAGRWVYEIENPGCGEEVDCNPGVIEAAEEKAKKYGLDPEVSEQEIAFDRAIPPGNVAGFYNLDTGEHGVC